MTDKKLQRQALVGADWICQYCGTSNAADINVCGSCGAARGDSPVQKVKEYGVGEAPTSGDMTFDDEPRPADATADGPKASRKLPLLIIIGIAAIALICLGIVGYLIFGGRDAEVTVTGFEWERAVEVEAFRTVTEEEWSLPAGARLISQREEIHHYNQVLDHYETRQREVEEQVKVGVETYVCGERDLGNGFFEDIECERDIYETQSRTESYEEPIYVSVPVYQPLYVYEIDKWIVVRTEESSGWDHSPFWPRANLGEDEREGDKSESYRIIFSDEAEERYEWETNLNEWQSFERGQAVLLKLNAMGDISEVELP